MTFGTDDRLHVSGWYSHNIVRFNIGAGASEVFVATASGGLASPGRITFGPDGNLYASSHVEGSTTVTDPGKRYSGATGAFLGDFVTAGSGGLDSVAGIAFGPDGNFDVANRSSGDVKRYSGQTGAFLGTFVAKGSGGLVSPVR